jgi:hypothetical protein
MEEKREIKKAGKKYNTIQYNTIQYKKRGEVLEKNFTQKKFTLSYIIQNAHYSETSFANRRIPVSPKYPPGI